VIEIYLYGELRRYAPDRRASGNAVIVLMTTEDKNVADILRQAGIPQEQVRQVFLNGQLLTTSCRMAPYLGYVTAQDRVPENKSPWNTRLQEGDRLGLFPPKMCMLVV